MKPEAPKPAEGEPKPYDKVDDTRGVVRAELKNLQALAAAKSAAAPERATKAHLEDLKDQIIRLLDPKNASAGTAVAPALGRGARESCWPELNEN